MIDIRWFDTNPAAGILFSLMIGDFMLGVLRAIKDKRVASNVGRDGLLKKAGILVFVALGEVLERWLPGIPLSEAFAGAFSLTEWFSVMENMKRLGIKVPSWITQYFLKLQPGYQDPDSRHFSDFLEREQARERSQATTEHRSTDPAPAGLAGAPPAEPPRDPPADGAGPGAPVAG